MVKRIVLIVLSFLLLALCVGGLFYLGQSNKGVVQQYKGIVVEFYSDDGTLLSREKYKKGETVVFPEYSAPEGYYFEGWKIDGSDEIITSYKVKSSTIFVPVLSQIYIYDGNYNFDYICENGASDYSSVSFDYKVISGDRFAVALFGDRWHNNEFEYVVFDTTGFCGVYAVSVTAISDGWLHVVLPYWVYESTCLSSPRHLNDYGSFDRFHVCQVASEHSVQNWGNVAKVFFKNITFND